MQMPHIHLDKKSSTPLYRQLSDAITELAAGGKLAPDAKLPSIRQLARALDVNNTTVISAYKLLEREAVIYSVVGSGTFVTPTAPVIEIPVLPKIGEGFINFADTSTEVKLFPVTAFRRSFDAVLDRDGGAAFDCHDTRGHKPLRESFCKLLEVHGISADPGNIQVIQDIQQGLQAIADAVLQPGDTVFVEKPTSQRAVAAFLSKRTQIVEMPLTKDGPDMAEVEALIKKHRPKLIYVMPHFQTPTGISYSAEKQRRLLALAHAADAYVIEEDQCSDFYYDGIKRAPLKALDDNDRVFYVKSFAKNLVPGLRMGFMLCPDKAMPVSGDIAAPGYIQRGFDMFLRSGAYELHMANIRSVYGRRYHKVVAAVNGYLGHLADFHLPMGGLGLWITPRCSPKNSAREDATDILAATQHVDVTDALADADDDVTPPDWQDDYCAAFLQRQVVVSPGRLFGAADKDGFMISFAAVPEDKMAEGIGVIASVLGDEEADI